MSRVLWFGDAGAHTGFGTVTHNIGERLVANFDHDIHVLAWNYKGDYVPTNLKLYVPNSLIQLDAYGQSRMVELLSVVEPDVVVILQDPYVIRKFLYQNNYDTERILLQYRPILSYLPVDGSNSPPLWDDLRQVTRPVLMSEWGRTWLPDAPVVHHGVDLDAFQPATREHPYISSGGMTVSSRKDAKRALGYDPDTFMVLRIDRNSARKNYADTWRALVPVMKRHSDIIVHFHCKASGDEGVEMPQLLSREPSIANRFFFPGQHNTNRGWPVSDLAILYNAADLFVSTSWGEGFGLTLAESLACEVPVVAQDCSAITEVVGPGGILIKPERPMTAPAGQDQWLPDVPAFSDAIEHLYNAGGTRRKMGQAGREHVAKFSWDVAAEKFDELIRQLAKENDEGNATTVRDLYRAAAARQEV